MSDRVPVTIAPFQITLTSPEFREISNWPLDSYVSRLLQHDIPQRVQFGNCKIWGYRDSESLAGFGTIDVSDDWREYTGGQLHPYIPLLAVNPRAS